MVSILCLRVDDGLFVTAPHRMKKAQEAISSKFNTKEWQNMKEKNITFLGVTTSFQKQTFVDDVTEYVLKIQPAAVKVEKEAKLEGEQLSSYRRLAMQLRWPAHLVMPEFLYRVSVLSQLVATATGKDLINANQLLAQMLNAAKEGGAKNVLRLIRGTPVFVSYFDASLGKTEAMCAQQAEIHFVTSKDVEVCPTRASLLDFHSSKVHRVVRSSLAAEACAMTSAADRSLYKRALFDALYNGCCEISSQWRKELSIGGTIITDAKGLNDHVNKTGSMASEKQTALDMLMVKRLVEDQVLCLRWVPTWKQLADLLTKDMITELLQKFRASQFLCLVASQEDHDEESRRSAIRKAQRDRRKQRMAKTSKKRSFSPM